MKTLHSGFNLKTLTHTALFILLIFSLLTFSTPVQAGQGVAAPNPEGVKLSLPEQAASVLVETISAGDSHTCVVKSDGTLVCWGSNYSGMSTPPAGTFTQVSAGSLHTCGLKSDGSLACWGVGSTNSGWMDYGQSIPPAGTFTQVSAGALHTCGLKSDGSLACWGYNNFGESTPPDGIFTQVSAHGYHTCGLKSDGSLVCWGQNNYGESTPPAGTFTQVSAGRDHICGLKSDGSLACWGDNSSGQSTLPAGTFTQVSAGTWHTCGLKSDGNLACWGGNWLGQSTPPAGTFTQVSAGYQHTCGLMSDGSVACWGDNSSGQSTPPGDDPLPPPNSISGMIQKGGSPYTGENLSVCLQEQNSWSFSCYHDSVIDPGGNYLIRDLPVGDYFVYLIHNVGGTNYHDRVIQYYGGVTNRWESTTVPVVDGAATGNIDFYLPANADPVINNYGDETWLLGININGTLELTLDAWDFDGDILSWRIATPASNGTASIVGSYISSWYEDIEYIPASDYEGMDRFDVEVADGKGGTDTLTVNAVVNPGAIAGTVYESDGITPIGDGLIVCISYYDFMGEEETRIPIMGYCAWPDADDGTYNFPVIPPNEEYRLHVQSLFGTVYEYYQETDIFEDATPVFVAPGATSVCIDFTLPSITGSIDPLADVGDGSCNNNQPIANPGGPYLPAHVSTEFSFDGSGSSDPDGDDLTYVWNFGDESLGTSVNPTHSYAVPSNYNVCLTVSDGYVDSPPACIWVEATNGAPEADTGGPYLAAVNSPVAFDGSGSTDPDGYSLTYAWDFGDDSTATGVAPSHSYVETGIYDICLTVNDGYDYSLSACTLAVVYDPEGGFVTGNGSITSPPGAYISDLEVTGKATFSFDSKYLKRAIVPTGNFKFQFKEGDLSFKSTSYEWLVIDGSNARFMGVGTINRLGEYNFQVTVDVGSPDQFSIKIWDDTGTVYDSGSPQALEGGNIVIH